MVGGIRTRKGPCGCLLEVGQGERTTTLHQEWLQLAAQPPRLASMVRIHACPRKGVPGTRGVNSNAGTVSEDCPLPHLSSALHNITE